MSGKARSFTFPSFSVPSPLVKVMQWQPLRGPFAITFACVVAMAISLVDQTYFKAGPFRLRAPAVISSILLVMDIGTTEQFYLSTTLRIMGTIAGLSLGLAFSVVEESLVRSYKDPKDQRHPGDWKLIIFRVMVLVPIIFSCTMLMKRYPKYAFPLVIMAVQTPSGLFAANVREAVSVTVSSVFAVLIAVMSIVTFENLSTENHLSENLGKAIEGVLSVVELALKSDRTLVDKFSLFTEQVHKSISTVETAIATYRQWRGLTCRTLKRDYGILVKPMRPLFYQAYSLYWSNTESYRAEQYSSGIMFCDSKELYDKYFAEYRNQYLEAVEHIRADMAHFYSKTFHTGEEVDSTLERVLEDYMWNGMYLAQEQIRANYMQYRSECFSTFGQRWNVTDFMRHLAMMTLAFVEYFRAMTVIFLRDEDQRAQILRHLDELSDALDQLRKDESNEASPKSPSGSPDRRSMMSAISDSGSDASPRPLLRGPTRNGL